MIARNSSPSLIFAGPGFLTMATRFPAGGTKYLSASWMVQFARSLLMSLSLPAAGRAITATSSEPSTLKSPTMKVGALPWTKTRSSPKMRRTAPATSAEVAGGSLASGSGAGVGRGVVTGIGLSARSGGLASLRFLQPENRVKHRPKTDKSETNEPNLIWRIIDEDLIDVKMRDPQRRVPRKRQSSDYRD